jgi:hypothetical protein
MRLARMGDDDGSTLDARVQSMRGMLGERPARLRSNQ